MAFTVNAGKKPTHAFCYAEVFQRVVLTRIRISKATAGQMRTSVAMPKKINRTKEKYRNQTFFSGNMKDVKNVADVGKRR